MADAEGPGRGTKRPAEAEPGALQALRRQLLARMAFHLEREEASVVAAADEAPDATILELGLTSAAGLTLKGWVLRTLDADLTTFELLKQPLNDVVEAIHNAQSKDSGLALPAPGPRPEPSAVGVEQVLSNGADHGT